MPSSSDNTPGETAVPTGAASPWPQAPPGAARASIVKSDAKPPGKRENMEETAAIAKIVGEYTKMLVEGPGAVAFLQGRGQATAANAERLTLEQAQNHERQMLMMKQSHERQLELDRMQE